MVNRRPAPYLRCTLTWLYVRGEFLTTILNFFGGSGAGAEGPSYHCASVGLASKGLTPAPSAMRLKSRRFILSLPQYREKRPVTSGPLCADSGHRQVACSS